jgi:hypothetical protein
MQVPQQPSDTGDGVLRPGARLRGSVDRARDLANTDPAVRAGPLAVEAMTWWCPPRTMVRPGEPVTVED